MTRSRLAGTALRVAVSAAVFTALIEYVGLEAIVSQLRSIDGRFVALALLLLVGESLVRCVNWRQLAREVGCALPLREVIHAYFVGGFIGAVLPSTLSTDAARSTIAAIRNGGRVEVLLATTVTLNLISLGAASLCALLACLWLFVRFGSLPPSALAALLAGGGYLAGLAVLGELARRRRARAPHGASDAPSGARHAVPRAVRRIAERFANSLLVIRGAAEIGRVGATAAASFALRTIGLQALLVGAGTVVPWAGLVVLGPLVAIAAALPISVAGFGGLQAVMVYVLGEWGVAPEQATAVSLVQAALFLVLHGLGSIPYVLARPALAQATPRKNP